MKNAAALLLILAIPLLSLAINNPGSNTFFHKGDLDAIKGQASREGKLYFVDFYADYCYACKLMDETTFVDESLAKYVQNVYIPYKVNVTMDIDGIMMKDEYKITVLPTILVFNSQGKLVGRYESMLSPSNMIKELKKYDIPENKISKGDSKTNEPLLATTPGKNQTELTHSKLTSKINIAPDRAVNVVQERTNSHATTIKKEKEDIIAFASANINETPIQQNPTKESSIKNNPVKQNPIKETPVKQNPAKQNPAKQNPIKDNPPSKEVVKEKITATAKDALPKEYNAPTPSPLATTGDEDKKVEGLFQFTVQPYKNVGYGVQIGVFAEYGNVLREVQKLQDKFTQPILVNISSLDNVVVYKIIVGSFDSTREAVAFRRMMQKKGTDGVIKDLSTIKQ
jgi:thiol-disulfide isomerase/thioredoxin